MFKDELGTIQGEKPKLFFKDNKKPRFSKARSVPFALTAAVEEELRKLEALGISLPLARSDYATPIVPIIKRDGSVRICEDHKVTVNPILDTERFPLPKADNYFQCWLEEKSSPKLT